MPTTPPDESDGPVPRELWQKPNLVFKMLGDLSNKVVADIGAGPYGYFTLQLAKHTEVDKVIAIDIDLEALQYINFQRELEDSTAQSRIETRLARPDNPMLKKEEADIVLIVNTYVFLPSPVNYLRNLRKGMTKNSRIIIIDWKKRLTPMGPSDKMRIAMGEIEQDLIRAGYVDLETNDQSLEYQYVISATAAE